MPQKNRYDSLVIGSGPNGLAAAITLARRGQSVCVIEAQDSPGGCVRSGELGMPGFVHDLYSAVFPLALSSPFFRSVPLEIYDHEWVVPPAALAHPFDDGDAAIIYGSVQETARGLGPDEKAYMHCMSPLVENLEHLLEDILQPLHIPRHPCRYTLFGLAGMIPAAAFSKLFFRTSRVRALFAGLAGHSILPMEHVLTSAFALAMGASAHKTRWPIAKGGAGSITRALTAHLRDLGGEIVLSSPIISLDGLPRANNIFFDLTPQQVVSLCRDRLTPGYENRLKRYRYGPGAFKIDWALHDPIPWTAQACSSAATVHVGGSFEEIAASERTVWRSRHPEQPFVICVQPSLFDESRAPVGRHTAWAYCHVPNGSTRDMTERIEQQIERFAPEFKDTIISRHTMSPHELQRSNDNLVGGDIAGGANTFSQFLFRPTISIDPYAMPAPGMYLCSASTPPGGGVHGMCGYNAAQSALKRHGGN